MTNKNKAGLTDKFRPPKTKACRACKVEKPLDEFYLNAESNDGRTNKCISCLIKADQKRKEERKEYGKLFFDAKDF